MTFQKKYAPYTPLEFHEVNQLALALADAIDTSKEKLIDILLKYESYEVAEDEIFRTLDLLKNLRENESYFKLRIGTVTSFLPRNQPLYAFTCFIIVPSLMASEVHFRMPHATRHFFSEIIELLNIYALFPNIIPSSKERLEFLKDRSALVENPANSQNRPATDAVIFTGTSVHADQLRLIFDRRTLFITNGAGHNPIVIGKKADLSQAVEAVLSLTLYNQGQDCAAPNSILIHRDLYEEFISMLRNELSKVKMGPYTDHACRVGPISNPEDLKRIQSFMVDNMQWIDKTTQGVIRTAEAIVEPTIICRPLAAGGNYDESFAPVFFVQEYAADEDLSLYFENQSYALNAMYVTLYGESAYTKELIGREVDGKVLHKKDTFLHNTHLHVPGIERGTQPYGGYGKGASSISINGETIAFPTLPQRDIYERVAKPLIEKGIEDLDEKTLAGFTEIQRKNVEKLLRMRVQSSDKHDSVVTDNNTPYLDLALLNIGDKRYLKIEEKHVYRLYSEPNAAYIANLDSEETGWIQSLKALLDKKSSMTAEEFKYALYEIPKLPDNKDGLNKARQIRFFQHVYQLLFRRGDGPRLGPFFWELNDGSASAILDL